MRTAAGSVLRFGPDQLVASSLDRQVTDWFRLRMSWGTQSACAGLDWDGVGDGNVRLWRCDAAYRPSGGVRSPGARSRLLPAARGQQLGAILLRAPPNGQALASSGRNGAGWCLASANPDP